MDYLILQIDMGIILGFIREFLTVRYTQSIIKASPVSAMLITVVIGLLDLAIILALIWHNALPFALSWLGGEAIAAYLAVKKRGQNEEEKKK
ncbi:MAG: hypothetical protein NC828_05020 [Candidatus Omnitrophica bacterium]|nr:hypothetical protein [Candidatus Omnitrophota bacterium]